MSRRTSAGAGWRAAALLLLLAAPGCGIYLPLLSGTAEGVVRDARSGAPLAGVRVVRQAAAKRPLTVELEELLTDAEGRFSFSNRCRLAWLLFWREGPAQVVYAFLAEGYRPYQVELDHDDDVRIEVRLVPDDAPAEAVAGHDLDQVVSVSSGGLRASSFTLAVLSGLPPTAAVVGLVVGLGIPVAFVVLPIYAVVEALD